MPLINKTPAEIEEMVRTHAAGGGLRQYMSKTAKILRDASAGRGPMPPGLSKEQVTEFAEAAEGVGARLDQRLQRPRQ